MLVVDDYPESASFIAEYLVLLGFECRVGSGGYEALELAAAFQPHAAILDLDMPDLHGCEVARTLCQMGAARPYLIALTGSVLPTTRPLAIAAGFDHFLLKPVVLSSLVRLLPSALVPATEQLVARRA
ncbi:MAG: response regulator [Myxococcota bacterium]|nr:response regulator [Myxococcota bacterium]